MASKSAELIGANKANETNQGTAEQAAASPLRQQVDSALAGPPTDKTKVTDQAAAPAADSSEPDDPFTHTNRIKIIARELDELTAQGKKPNDVIQVGDKQVKVKDLVAEMKQTIKTEVEAARNAAKKINQNTVEVMLNTNIQDKNRLARELGLDPAKVTQQVLDAEKAKAASNPARRAKVEELEGNMQERAAMESLRHAPAYVKMVEAEVVAKGYGNPNLALGQEVSPEETRRAFDLLKLAGNEDPELKVSELYRNAETSVGMTFAASQQERSQKIITLMESATEAGRTGQQQTVTIDGQTKQLTQEELLKEANRLADKINISWIASQAALPRNIENGTATEMLNIVYISSHARLDYVNYMTNHGQTKEAQTLFNKVKADTPELIYDEKGAYRDASLQRLDQTLTLGVNVAGATFDTAQGHFLANVEKGNIYEDPTKPGASATENLKQMKELNTQFKREMEAADQVLIRDKQNLTQRQQDMEKRGNLSEADAVELERVKREIKVIDATMAQRHAYFDRRQNLTTYMEGCWFEAKEDYANANKAYKQFDAAEKDTELKKSLDLEGKTGRTEPGFKGWWNQNWKYFAVGAAIVVAAGATILTLGVATAPAAALVGGTLAAVGITAAPATIATIAAVGTGIAATAAGTAGGAAAHWAVERSVNSDAGWQSAWNGAKVGLMTSSMIVAPWATGLKTAAASTTLAGAEGAAAVTGATATAANVANASRIMTMARTVGVGAMNGAARFGITPTSLAAGYTVTGVTAAGDVAFGVKSGQQALYDMSWQGLINSAFIGQAMKWGVAAETATAATAAKTTIPSALGLTGTNAAIGFGTSGVMEYVNYRRGTKDGGEAFKDFVRDGAINTVTVGVLRKYGLSDAVGKATSANLQNTRYAAQGILMQESFGLTFDIVGTKYLMHDLAQRPAFMSEGGMSNLGPMFADTNRRLFGDGLNIKHPGERQRMVRNLDFLGNDLNSALYVDPLFIKPSQINRQGLFFSLDDQRSR